MKKLKTTLCELDFNYDALDRRFLFYRVNISNSADSDYQTLFDGLNEYDAFLSITEYRRKKTYFVMTRLEGMKSNNDDIAFELINPRTMYPYVIGCLLSKALGLLNSENFYAGTGDTFFLADITEHKGHKVFKCFKFVFGLSSFYNKPHLLMNQFTLSHLECHKKDHGDGYWDNADRYARHSVDESEGILRRDPFGKLIKKGVNSKKTTVPALDFSNTASKTSSESLEDSRISILNAYIESFEQQFSDVVKLNFVYFTPAKVATITKKKIENNYQNIYGILNNAGGVQVVNVSSNKTVTSLLKSMDLPVKFTFVDPQNRVASKPTLLIVDTKQTYEKNGGSDVKWHFYGPGEIVQSIYGNNFEIRTHSDARVSDKSKDDFHRAQLDTIKTTLLNNLKEICIKLECQSNRFLISDVKGDLWFIYPYERKRIKNKGYEERRYGVLKVKDSTFEYEEHHIDYFDDKGIELPEITSYANHHYVVDMGKDVPQVCTIINEQVRLLPEIEGLKSALDDLKKSEDAFIERSFIQRFIDESMERCGFSTRLQELLDSQADKKKFTLNDFRKAELKSGKIANRGKAAGEFFERYHQETGQRLKANLKSAKAEEGQYLHALKDIVYFKDGEAYFSGIQSIKSSAQNFMILRSLDGPDYLKELCFDLTHVFYVRHLQSTALPFPFKYIREMKSIRSAIVEYERAIVGS